MLKPCNGKPWWIVPETSTVSQTVDQVLYIVLSVTEQTVYQGGKDSKVVYYLYIIYKNAYVRQEQEKDHDQPNNPNPE